MRRRWIGGTLFTYSGALEVFAFWKKLLIASGLATSVSLIILLYHPVEEKTGSAVKRERERGWRFPTAKTYLSRKVYLTDSSGRIAPQQPHPGFCDDNR